MARYDREYPTRDPRRGAARYDGPYTPLREPRGSTAGGYDVDLRGSGRIEPDPYGRINRGGRSRFGSGYGGAERGERWDSRGRRR